MSDVLQQLEHRIGHTFRDRTLLERAVTHPSYLQDHPETLESNQRLEFLGDAVLQLVLTEDLFGLFPLEREGVLSKHRAALANGVFLTQLAREMGLEACLRLGASEESTGGRSRASALEDAFEALIGALYLDSDIDQVRRVLHQLYGPIADRLAVVENAGNPKGQLQERVQPLHGNQAVRYEVSRIEGQDHAREYEVSVYVLERLCGTGRGKSKKQAEEAAAREALVALSAESA